jgi:Na+-translocating ferredoxin:NAD+ oxidoreductase RnfD subunit
MAQPLLKLFESGTHLTCFPLFIDKVTSQRTL